MHVAATTDDVRPEQRGTMGYRVAITRGYAEPDGSTIFGDIGLHRLTDAGIEWRVLPEQVDEVRPDQLADTDALFVLGHERVTAASLPRDGRLRHVARFGAGFDAVDVAACADRGVVVTTTPDAVRRPVADSAVALLFALAHNLLPKDRLVREGRWDLRARWQGPGLGSATVGVVGFGGIGQEVAARLRALDLSVVAYNRSDRSREARELGVRTGPLPAVLAEADHVIVTVAANAGTRHLIGAAELDAMRPSATLINLARGSVVDEQALAERLADGRLRGAGLDVFETEPLPTSSPLVELDNVVLAPHSLCWTDDFAAAVSASAMQAIIDVSRGRPPAHPVAPPAADAR
jgi:phosphoglycerate dehydrogenase-like enzyme